MFLALRKSSKNPNLGSRRKPVPVNTNIKTRNQVEVEYLKKKYGWVNGHYENLLAKKTPMNNRMITAMFRLQKSTKKAIANRPTSRRISPVMERIAPVKKTNTAVNSGKCHAIKKDGKKCSFKAKTGTKFCGKHSK